MEAFDWMAFSHLVFTWSISGYRNDSDLISKTKNKSQRSQNHEFVKQTIFTLHYKVGRVFTMVIWSEFRMRKYRDGDHTRDASHFNLVKQMQDLKKDEKKLPIPSPECFIGGILKFWSWYILKLIVIWVIK